MKIISLNQGSRDWFRWRQGGLGGSDAAAVLGISPWATPQQLYERRLGIQPEQEDDFAMRRGRRLEPIARDLYEELTGNLVAPLCGQHDELGWMRASLDGITLLGDVLCEIKAPKWEAHAQALDGQVPDYYWPQCQHQLAVSGAEVCHYVSLTEHKKFGASKLKPQIAPPVVVHPDPDYIRQLVEAETSFWRCLQRRQPPTWDVIAFAAPTRTLQLPAPRERTA